LSGFSLQITSRLKILQPSSAQKPSSDAALATSLAKLWPNREHESNAIKNLFCSFGLHRWRQLDLEELVPDKEVHYCFWCSKVRIDKVIYNP
jgi:hypothetical protein